MSISSLCQQKAIKNYQNLLANDFKVWCIRTKTKQKMRINIEQANVDIIQNVRINFFRS